MKNRLVISFITIFIALTNIGANAQSLMQVAEEAKRQAEEMAKQKTSRYNDILNSWDMSKYKQFIVDYPNGGEYTLEIKSRVEEIESWNQAKSTNTMASYNKYLNTTKYNKFSYYANQEIERLKREAEKEAWCKVQSQGTLQAYEQYLKDNPTSGYKAEAEKIINQIKASDAWANLKYSNSISDLTQFVTTYPNAYEKSLAENRIRELKGKMYYDKGDFASAYSEFSKLGRWQVSSSNLTAYDGSFEYNDYSNLKKSYSSESSMQTFLNKYPNSVYKNNVSNMIALLKARRLDSYASTYDYDLALSYAKDEVTKKMVKGYISDNKKMQNRRNREIKAEQRRRNGGTVNLGWDICDLGFGESSIYYNTGLMLRFGNYKDPVQFALGLKIGALFYDDEYSYDYYSYYYDDNDYGDIPVLFHMPVLAQLKVNLFDVTASSKFYLYGKFQYDLTTDDDYEGKMAWGAGLGFAWKNVDWSFYLRKDLNGPEGFFGGTSIIYYWQL